MSPPLWVDSSSHFPFSFPARCPTNWWFGYLGYFFFPHRSPVDTVLWTKPVWTLVLKLYISITQVVKNVHSCAPAPRDPVQGIWSEAWACALWHRCAASHTISDAQDQPVMGAVWPRAPFSGLCKVLGSGLPFSLRSDSWIVRVSLSDSHLHTVLSSRNLFEKPGRETDPE